MIADVAHELRTPVSVLQGNLEGIVDGVLPMSLEEIATLRDESALLSRLINDLRVLSLADSGHLTLDKESTELAPLISRSIEAFKLEAETKEVPILSDFSDGLPYLNVDADRIEQVFRNLIGNALRHTESGGKILVTVSIKSPEEICVLVQDTGMGIPQEDLPNVFDRFYRADKSRNRSRGGSGIGLAIAKQIVEAHGGTISVESVGSNKGNSFQFTLPIT